MPLVLVDLLSYTGTKGGMETYTRELYRQLGSTDTGYTFVGLASSELMSLDRSWFPGEIIDSRISGENRFVWAYGELFVVARWAKRLGADLIHSPATLGPRASAMPTVITMHDMLYFSHPQYMSTSLYTLPVRWMEKQAAANAARILTISTQSSDDIQKYLGVSPTRIDVVPLAGTRTPLVVERAAASAEPLVLATGNRRPHKNWEGLVRALALVDETIRPRMVVTGSHGDDPLRAVVDELDLGDWVDLQGWVSQDDLAALYSRATVMAMPSFCEGFGLPVLEAMMSGVPVILSDIPVFREIAGDAALYFDPTSLPAIAEAITTAVTRPDLLDVLVARGRERSARYSWERTAAGTVAAFSAALTDATSR
jgi:glycosyltransferase involved in cell wall biosynthesis